MIGFRLFGSSNGTCKIEVSSRIPRTTFRLGMPRGSGHKQTVAAHISTLAYNITMSQSTGMVIAAAIMVFGAIGLASLAVFLASRKNRARRRAGPR
jgi:hypothetical protein